MIFGAASIAFHFAFTFEFNSALAHPALNASGNANSQGKVGKVFGYNRAGCDKCKAADFNSANYRGVSAKTCAGAYKSFLKFIFTRNMCSRIDHVGENNRRSAEDVIAKFDEVINRDIVLHAAAPPDFYPRTDVGVLAKRTFGPDFDVGSADMTEVPEFGALTDLRAGIDDGGFVNENVLHRLNLDACDTKSMWKRGVDWLERFTVQLDSCHDSAMTAENLPVAPEKAKLSIIFSFYNEEQNIPEAIERLSKILQEEIRKGYLGDYELVFVDDDSKDRSRELLEAAACSDKRIKYVRMARNFGHDVCALAGMEMCTGDMCIYLDADLQDPPELIPEMLKIWREKNADIVHTVRTSREGEPWMKLFITKIGYAILRKFSRVKIESNSGDFKLITRRALNEILKFREVNPFMRGIVTFVGFRQERLYYVRKARFAGNATSVFNPRVLSFFLDSALISFSDAPLKMVSMAGFLSFGLSILVAAYVLIEKFIGNVVPGWAGPMVIMSFLGGIQLLSMGILGLYLNSIFLEVKRRPQYIVESTINL